MADKRRRQRLKMTDLPLRTGLVEFAHRHHDRVLERPRMLMNCMRIVKYTAPTISQRTARGMLIVSLQNATFQKITAAK